MWRDLRPNGVQAALALFILVVARSSASGADAVAAVTATGPDPDLGVPIEGWIFYPSFFAGAVFNDNVYARPYGKRAALGIRIRPSVRANVDNGLHKTTAYFTADAQFYPGHGTGYQFYPVPALQPPPTNATGSAGFAHVWAPLSDLNVYVLADYTRQNGLFGANFGAGAPLAYIPSSYTVSGVQQYSNQFSGSVAVEKKFSDWFLRASTGAQYVAYDSRPSVSFPTFGLAGNSGNAQNGVSYTASLRGGWWITPQVYGFVEPALDLRRYQFSISDTNGYRVVAGLGSDLVSLVRGEIYGGYQSQSSDHGLPNGTISAPTYGARLFYYPTPYFTITAAVDQTLAAAAAPTPLAATLGQWSPGSRNARATLQADYAFSPYWTAFVRGGYGDTRWANLPRVDTAWAGGAGVSYTFWRNIAITLDYQFQKTSSNSGSFFNFANAGSPGTWGYTQNVISAGITYRY